MKKRVFPPGTRSHAIGNDVAQHSAIFGDGDYASTVDDFDGIFQSLKTESGAYAIRLEAPGYETTEFDVRITPRQKITYRGGLPRE